MYGPHRRRPRARPGRPPTARRAATGRRAADTPRIDRTDIAGQKLRTATKLHVVLHGPRCPRPARSVCGCRRRREVPPSGRTGGGPADLGSGLAATAATSAPSRDGTIPQRHHHARRHGPVTARSRDAHGEAWRRGPGSTTAGTTAARRSDADVACQPDRGARAATRLAVSVPGFMPHPADQPVRAGTADRPLRAPPASPCPAGRPNCPCPNGRPASPCPAGHSAALAAVRAAPPIPPRAAPVLGGRSAAQQRAYLGGADRVGRIENG